jgi:pSer/pThr/pTyr-binding forkhead associated (FHA) protein
MGGVTIGSARGNRLVLENAGVSRHHAVVQVRGSVVTFVDLKSTNGSRINGERVTKKALTDGDRILLAEEVELVYERRPRGGRPARPRESTVESPPSRGSSTRRGANDDDADDE